MEITKDQYQEALALINKSEEAKQLIQKYEEQLRYKDDPNLEIIEKGEIEFVKGESIRNSPFLWRATQIKYVHPKGTLLRTVEFANPGESPDLFNSISDLIERL